MNKKKFRFGVTSTGATTGDEWKKKVVRAEELEYSTLLVPDHFVEQIATMPGLAMAAAFTSRIRVGSVVCSNDFRHPLLLAKEAATIDMLSNGRFELGIGAGWLKSEYDAIGIPFDPPKQRVGRFEEAVKVIKNYFQNGSVEFKGSHYHIHGGKGLDRIPEPVQKPYPPILIGGGGKRMLSIAAREADIIGLAVKVQANGSGPDPRDIAVSLAEKIAWVKEEAAERFENIEFNLQTWAVVVTNHREQAAAQLAKQFPLPVEILLNLPYLLIGTEDEIGSQLEECRSQLGISYFSVFDRHMEEFAPIVSRLSGK